MDTPVLTRSVLVIFVEYAFRIGLSSYAYRLLALRDERTSVSLYAYAIHILSAQFVLVCDVLPTVIENCLGFALFHG